MSHDLKNKGLTTRNIHAGQYTDPATMAVAPPIIQSSTFAFKNCAHGAALFSGEGEGHIYTRMSNPTIGRLEEAGTKLLDNVDIMTLAVSLGGIETLIQHPSSMTHATMPRESRVAAGITDGLVRVSIGCEDIEDILADFDHAFSLI